MSVQVVVVMSMSVWVVVVVSDVAHCRRVVAVAVAAVHRCSLAMVADEGGGVMELVVGMMVGVVVVVTERDRLVMGCELEEVVMVECDKKVSGCK